MGDLPPLPESCMFLVPKAGSRADECEDAGGVWLGEPRTGSDGVVVTSLYASVSDGASESLLARAWAQRLVTDAIESMSLSELWWQHSPEFVRDLMVRAAGHWDRYLEWYQADRTARGRPIAWYERPGLEKGAFATVLGVEIQSVMSDDGAAWRWHAFALGDSCLFQLRDGAVCGAFPVGDLAEFGITPQLLGSRNRDVELVSDRVSLTEGELLPGDELLLVSDALAAWLFAASDDSGALAGEELAAVSDGGLECFTEWVDGQRECGRMRNDDVTLIRIQVRAEV